jgi:hypothetical protein
MVTPLLVAAHRRMSMAACKRSNRHLAALFWRCV